MLLGDEDEERVAVVPGYDRPDPGHRPGSRKRIGVEIRQPAEEVLAADLDRGERRGLVADPAELLSQLGQKVRGLLGFAEHERPIGFRLAAAAETAVEYDG